MITNDHQDPSVQLHGMMANEYPSVTGPASQVPGTMTRFIRKDRMNSLLGRSMEWRPMKYTLSSLSLDASRTTGRGKVMD